ncbi:MAG: Fic family protein [Clostridia bacterium]|nr:Fic family protein [Clostridia bacterium]
MTDNQQNISLFINNQIINYMTEKQLNESLEIMKERYRNPEHTTRDIFQGESELGEKHVKRLVEGGYLRRIIDGWYYVPFNREEEDTTEWYLFYWSFVVTYLDFKYKEEWSLGADDTLLYLSGCGVLPRQLVIRSPHASGAIRQLPLGFELLEIEADIPDETLREERYGLRIYPLHLALLKASPSFCRKHPREARACLALIEDEQPLVDAAVRGGCCRGACKVAGGLKSIGNLTMPEAIIMGLRRHGYEAEIENPFREDIGIPQEQNAVASLVRLLWTEMRYQVADIPHNFCLSQRDWSVTEIMDMTGRAFVTDAAHSLGLQGYSVSEEMVSRAIEDDESGEGLYDDEGDVAAVLAYRDAFQRARTDIIDSLTGGEEASTMINLVEEWHIFMESHLRAAGKLKPGGVPGYRKEDCPVRHSVHVPVQPDALPEVMSVLSHLLTNEKSSFVRAVLGHFFIVYIHPFMDDNALMARLFMNSQLVSGGYPWTVIPVWKSDMYEAALEKACTKGEIYDLAHLVAESIFRKDITVDSEELED